MQGAESIKPGKRIREPIVDGLFYSADGDELRKEVDGYISSASPGMWDAFALVSPHAGYAYCGECMGAAYAAAEDRPVSRVVVLAPVHREPKDEIFLSESDYFLTPFGQMPVDTEIVHDIETCSTRIIRNDIPHLEEHAIEVQLPFIHRLFPDARLIPVLLGRTNMSNVRILSRALDTALGPYFDDTLFVASSNLCAHCGHDQANTETDLLYELIERRDAEGLVASYNRKDITACGAGCIAAVLTLSVGDIELRVHTRKTSADVDIGIDDAPVHYGGLSFHLKKD